MELPFFRAAAPSPAPQALQAKATLAGSLLGTGEGLSCGRSRASLCLFAGVLGSVRRACRKAKAKAKAKRKASSQSQPLGRSGRFWRSLDVWRWHWSSEPQRPKLRAELPNSDGESRDSRERPKALREISEDEVREFEEFGVVLLRNAITEWVPFLKEAVEHQMEHPQVSAFVTGLRSFFSMDYVQAGLFLTNDRFFDFWKSSNVPALVAQLLRCKEVRLIVDQLNVNPHCPPFTDAEKFHTDVGVISAVARAEEVVRVWIPLSGMRRGTGTLEFKLKGGERRRFEEVEPGDVLIFTPTIPHRVLFPENNYDEDRCVVIASLHGSVKSQSPRSSEDPMAVPEFPRLFPSVDEAELRAHWKAKARFAKLDVKEAFDSILQQELATLLVEKVVVAGYPWEAR
ncbi:unnamed protein product [Symbiodinium sp. CCMP2456]|nr:unnamed protein product [Symbiodinium sp. CCMP2456]